MHFWIDKRSSYGMGHNRSMAGFSHQHRRMRSKSIVTPIRQHPPSIPSTSQQQFKTILHINNMRPPSTHQPRREAPQSSSNSIQLNPHHVPVVHSVYPRDELPITHVVESLESSRRNKACDNWPLYLKIGFEALFLLFALVALKFCYNNELTAPQLIVFSILSIMFFVLTTTISILRMRKNRMFRQRIQHEHFSNPTVQAMPAQVHIVDNIEPPPPYAIAVHLPEKQSTPYKLRETPPPSYEKINDI